MPTPRKTLAQLAASGTLAKNVGRYKKRIASTCPTTKPIGNIAPRHFTRTERGVWAEVVKSAPPGLLHRSDRLAVEVLVKMIGRVRGPDAKTSDFSVLSNLLGRLGLNPVDRMRMDLPSFPTSNPEEHDDWAVFD